MACGCGSKSKNRRTSANKGKRRTTVKRSSLPLITIRKRIANKKAK